MSPPGVVRSDTVVTTVLVTVSGQTVSPPGVVRSDTVVTTVLVTV